MSAPTVSVVLPTHNRSSTLGPAIDSVLRGTYDDLELLVIDDASDDDTEEVLSRFDDERLTVISLSERIGAAAARNVGIEAARGNLLAFQDSDDRWTPEHLEVLVAALGEASPTAVVAYGIVRYDSGRVFPGAEVTIRDGDLRKVLTRYNFVDLPSAVARAEVIDSVGGFDPELPRLQDWDLFLRLADRGPFVHVDRVVLHAGSGDDCISQNAASYYLALPRILERHRALFAAEPEYEVSYRLQLARHDLQRGRAMAGVRHALRAGAHPIGLARWAKARIFEGRSPVART